MNIFAKAAIGAFAGFSMFASADIVPVHHINHVDIQSRQVVMSAPGASWNVSHGCDLFLDTATKVSIRPAHKTHPQPHRMNRIGEYDSLVISVDGRNHVCKITSIQRTGQTVAAR